MIFDSCFLSITLNLDLLLFIKLPLRLKADLDSAKVVNGQIIYEEEFYSSQNGIDFEIGGGFSCLMLLLTVDLVLLI